MEVPLGRWGVQHHSPRDSGGVRPTCTSGNGGCGTSRDPWEAPPLSAASREHLRRQTPVVTYRRERLVNPAFQRGSIAPQRRNHVPGHTGPVWTACLDSRRGRLTMPASPPPPGWSTRGETRPSPRGRGRAPSFPSCETVRETLLSCSTQGIKSGPPGLEAETDGNKSRLDSWRSLISVCTVDSVREPVYKLLRKPHPRSPHLACGHPSTLPALPTPPRLSERLPLRAPEGEMWWRARGHELWESFGIYRGSQQRGEEVTATPNVRATRKSKKREQSRKCDTTKGQQ